MGTSPSSRALTRRCSISPSSTTTPSERRAVRLRRWARTQARAATLAVAGARALPSPGVHLLAGHDAGEPGRQDPAAIAELLQRLDDVAELVPVERAVDLVRSGAPVDHPVVAFTFDDGYLDCHRYLAPALRDRGLNAAFFVSTGYIDATPDRIADFNQRVRSPGRLPMTSAMVRELADEGFVIGAHTRDHRRIDSDDLASIHEQVVDGRRDVESMTGRPCPWFAWPYGSYDDVSDTAMGVVLDTYELAFSSDRYETVTSHGGRVLNRRHFEIHWPATHVRYFLRSPRHQEV